MGWNEGPKSSPSGRVFFLFRALVGNGLECVSVGRVTVDKEKMTTCTLQKCACTTAEFLSVF